MTRFLVISHDMVGSHMAGPGIRYWEISRGLAARHRITLACPNQTDLPGQGIELAAYNRQDPDSLTALVQRAESLLLCGDTLELFPWIKDCGKPIVVDLYDPFILENLEINRSLSVTEQQARQESGLRVLKNLLETGDFFLCANLRQRDFWLGMLAAWGRLTPEAYRHDPSLEALIAVVPFGLPVEPPRKNRPVLKGVWPGIRNEDKVVLWGGGVWDWLDPISAVRAMGWLCSRRDDVRLFFLGTRHPNREAVPEMRASLDARRLSEEMGLLDRYVFFNDWVPYPERGDYLLEADLGISLHLDLVETRFSSRTRLLDYFWAGLPMVITRGDPLAEQVQANGLGLLVDFQDSEGAGKALLQLLEQPQLRDSLQTRFQGVRDSLHWGTACAPLLRFCDRPRLAARGERTTTPQVPAAGADVFSWAISRLTGIRSKPRTGS